MIKDLIARYRDRGLLIDANLLVGLVIGLLDRNYLKDNRATIRPFTAEDFDLLVIFVERFNRLITTPHLLTEVSNLCGKLPKGLHEAVRRIIQRLVNHKITETNIGAVDIVNHDLFLRLGVADTAIQLIAPNQYLVMTDELTLFGTLHKRGVDVINFNHIRFS